MANCSSVEVTAWVKIGDGATIDYHVCNEGEVEFDVGGCDGFVLATSELGLHNLIDRARRSSVRSRARSPATTRVARRRDPL